MTPPGPNPDETVGPDPREERLGELINEFVDRRERGEALSEEEFLSAHPEDAKILREHLDGLDLLERLGSSTVGQTFAADPQAQFKGSSAQEPLGGADSFHPKIAGYEVLKQIGRGGMGVVFKAIQLSTKRAVALKLLLEGPLASESSRRRFEREIALAAQLRHPNIIPIYDSGVADGRMYYAMEYVHGLAVSDYLKMHYPAIPARLQLFVKICAAVSHAHQRGVVHRDLKPSNVMIDGDQEPHILDFGLAKASALGDMTTSVTAQVVGTPAYMSPEQASGDPSAIDTRTDVYSLGVLLYEMLTEKMPYDTSGAMGSVLHNIAHAEPAAPGKFSKKIGGELTSILFKALEKSKEDRYQSVDAISSDVQRFLAGEPISARPVSALYLLRKALVSNRLAVGFSGLVLSFAVITWGVAHYYSTKFEMLENKVSEQQIDLPADDRRDGQPPRPVAEWSAAEIEAIRRDVEFAGKNLDPRVRELALELSKSGVDPREAVVLAMLRLFGNITETAGESEEAPVKEFVFDPAMFSGEGVETVAEQAPQPSPTQAEFDAAMETVARYLQGDATRPATSQPAAAQPATTQPAPIP